MIHLGQWQHRLLTSWPPFARNTPTPDGPHLRARIVARDHQELQKPLYIQKYFKRGHPLLFSSTPLPPPLVSLTTPTTGAKARNPIRLENEWADDMALKFPVRVQYKVYSFETNPLMLQRNKPKQTKKLEMLGNKQGILDKKRELQLQLKGLI